MGFILGSGWGHHNPYPETLANVYNAMVAGFNLVFPETLEERNSVERLLNHAQYDGGGFR